jgi:hypothetical protein
LGYDVAMPSMPAPGPPLVASFVADLPTTIDAGDVVRVHIDHLGAPYLVANRSEAEALSTWRLTPAGDWSFRAIPSEGLRHPRTTPLPDEGWLVVGGTSRGGPNARLLDASGTVTTEFRVGDAIEEIQATERGSVWVSYFDEGVFGDDLGQAGLLCFDLAENVTFSFDSLSDSVPPIDDCYALNVVSDREQWTCYYSEFPVVQIVDGELLGVWPEVAPPGVGAFAISSPLLLFDPGYEEDDKLTLLDLSAAQLSRHPVATPEGNHTSLKRGRYCARGSKFFFCDDVLNRILVVDLEALTFG